MPALTTPDRMAQGVGFATLILGAALIADPAKGRLIALDRPSAARMVGLLDLSLVPGLILGPRRGRWMAGRIALNCAIAGYALLAQRSTGRSTRAVTTAAALSAVSCADGAVLLRLKQQREN